MNQVLDNDQPTRRLAIALASILLIALSSKWWLGWLASLLPPPENKADFLQSLGAIIGLITFLVTSVVSTIRWINNNRANTRSAVMALQPLRQTTFDHIVTRLRQGGEVEWVDRGAVRLADLELGARRLVIIGPRKVGKTREAIELLRKLVMQKVLPDKIYELGPNALLSLDPSAIEKCIHQTLSSDMSLVLFIDDLPYHYPTGRLDRLTAAIKALMSCKEVYILATARQDQLQEGHWEWLKKSGFHLKELPPLDDNQAGELVDHAASLHRVQVDTEARQDLAAGSHGIPEQILLSLQQLREQGISHLKPDQARQVSSQSMEAMIRAAHTELRIHHPPAWVLLRALAAFHNEHLTPKLELVIGFGAFILSQNGRRLAAPIYRHRCQQNFSTLSPLGVELQEQRVYYKDILVETVSECPLPGELEAYLMQRGRWGLLDTHRQEVAWALFELGLNAQVRQDFGRAIQIYSRSLAIMNLPAQKVRLYTNRGIAFSQAGDSVQAIADFSSLLILLNRQPSPDPNELAHAYLNRGRGYCQAGMDEQAIEDFSRALILFLDPGSQAYTYLQRGNARHRLGYLEQAIQDYTQVIEIQTGGESSEADDRADAYLGRGNAFQTLGRYERAIQDFTRALGLYLDEERKAKALLQRGIAYRSTGDLIKSIFDFGIVINPRLDVISYSEHLMTGWKTDQSQELDAIDFYVQKVFHDLRPADLFEPSDLAPIALDVPSESSPGSELDQAHAHFNRGVSFMDLGELELALADFNAACELYPEGPDKGRTLLNLGLVHSLCEEFEQATEDFSAALGLLIDPVIQAIAYLNRGKAYARLDDPRRALADYSQAQELFPQNNLKAEACTRCAEIHYQRADLDNAHQELIHAITLDPDHGSAHYHLARLHARQGQVPEALACLERACELDQGFSRLANNETDFDSIRNMPEFQNLVAD